MAEGRLDFNRDDLGLLILKFRDISIDGIVF